MIKFKVDTLYNSSRLKWIRHKVEQ